MRAFLSSDCCDLFFTYMYSQAKIDFFEILDVFRMILGLLAGF